MARPERDLPRVVIIGGGFGGLEVAKRLARAPVQTTLIDRRNYHLFQPMLYQVANAALSPTDIASSIRQILRHVSNCRVVLATATGIDVTKQLVQVGPVGLKYDYLVLAAGATHAYFGNEQWADLAPGLKTLEGATEIRRRILLAFETAEYEGAEDSRRAELTFAVVGGGPTGVELAGAIKEIASQCLTPDFRNIDTKTTRVILIQSNDRLLPQFDPKLSLRAQQDLEAMGVEVRLNSRVTDVTPDGLRIGDQFVPARNVLWAAGVAASPLGANLGVTTDRSGRVPVGPDLSLPGHPELFVIGDMAAAKSADSQQPVPGVAQGALQMGRHVASIIAAETAGRRSPRKPFVYRDKGSMATIGKAKAVVQIGRWRFGGFPAWLLWGGIHIFFLVGFRNRIVVSAKWLWNWMIGARDARLIMGDAQLRIGKLLDEEVIELDDRPASHDQRSYPPESSAP